MTGSATSDTVIGGSATTEHVHIAILGTGFGGLGAAIRLKQDGERDFVVLERAGDVGGTWRDNTYPGCACDVPSHLYSFSFALEPTWTHSFSPQPEIHAYLRRTAERFGVLPFIRFHTTVESAAWDEKAQRWAIETSAGPLTADVVVAAPGPLAEPAIPQLPGLETFQGKAFHSARWDHDYDLTGRKVAVIGTGASAIQFVPEIRKQVEKLTLFQRTAPWVLPRRDRTIKDWEHLLYKAFPPAQRLARTSIYWTREFMFLPGFLRPRFMKPQQKLADGWLERIVKDPELRAKLTPDYTIGCKRILLSTKYLPALVKENVEVVTDRITEVRPHSVVTADGTEHEVDTIIFGTGFHVTDLPIAEQIKGRDGRSLADSWEGSPKAYFGTSVVGFPNLFLVLGPNTGLGHTSVIVMIEAQIEHVRAAMKHLRKNGNATMEITRKALDGWIKEVDRKMQPTVWSQGGCASYYVDKTGRNSSLWPGFTFTFRQRARRLNPSHYTVVPRRETPARELVEA